MSEDITNQQEKENTETENQDDDIINNPNITIEGIGEVTLRKFTPRDWELIRNKVVSSDMDAKQSNINYGTFNKIITILGVNTCPALFKSSYPQGMLLTSRLLEERTREYDTSSISIFYLDKLANKINKYNTVDPEDLERLKKK